MASFRPPKRDAARDDDDARKRRRAMTCVTRARARRARGDGATRGD
jgi:hypothetical protein